MFRFVSTRTTCFIKASKQIRLMSTVTVDGHLIKNIGFIGLGNMGSSMSKNLMKKGFKVTVYDINKQAAQQIGNEGATVANSTHELAENVDCIVTMLPASPHLKALYLGENGILKNIKSKSLVIDSSTIHPTTSQELSTHFTKAGIKFIDAPVSGGYKAAELGTLTFMVGGDPNIVSAAEPILLGMGSRVVHCGPVGSGLVAKVCNNLLLGISMVGLSEALNLGVKLGLDPKLLSSIINCSSGRCWSSETYNPVPGVMADVPSSRDYKAGFAAQMILKDLKIADDAANEIGANLLMGKKSLQVYQELTDKQMGEKDFSIAYKYFNNK